MRPDPLSELVDRNRRIPVLVAALTGVLALAGPASQAASAKKPDTKTVPGDLLVGFRSDVSAAEQQKLLKSVGADEKKSFNKIHGSLAHL
jgi:Fervidolysin N-terminal prodomain